MATFSLLMGSTASADPDKYACALRAIGQELADLFPENLEIDVIGNNFVARGQGRDPTARLGTDTKANPITKAWKKLFHYNFTADPVQSLLLAVPFERTYTPEDIDQLDAIGRSQRRTPDATPDLYSLGEKLRIIGRIVDTNRGDLTKLFKNRNSVKFYYRDQKGETHSEELSSLALYRIQRQYYSQRNPDKPTDAWAGIPR